MHTVALGLRACTSSPRRAWYEAQLNNGARVPVLSEGARADTLRHAFESPTACCKLQVPATQQLTALRMWKAASRTSQQRKEPRNSNCLKNTMLQKTSTRTTSRQNETHPNHKKYAQKSMACHELADGIRNSHDSNALRLGRIRKTW